MTETVSVDLGSRRYDIVIGSGIIHRTGSLMANALKCGRAVIVTDETVAALHLAAVEASLDHAGIRHHSIRVPPGETSKTLAALEDLIERLLALELDRSVAIVALGGGVIGDLAGFAAAVTLRGLPLIQIPTTLLAQVDSAVGGKTGVNSPLGKNLIGSFHQPRLVVADIGTLDTLPRRQVLAGYAEIVKYGAIDDPEFFAWLETNGPALIDGDEDARTFAVARSCRRKAAIVTEDEREAGRRALLNLGHTFGHALEADVGYGTGLLHGEAVALGMVLAFDLSVRLRLCPEEDAKRLRRHLDTVGLPTDLTAAVAGHAWDPDTLIGNMARDKKVQNGHITFILARGLGQAFIATDVDPTDVRAVLDSATAN